MTREQKRSLLLIAAAAVLLIGLHFVPVTGWLKLVLYLIPYLLVGGETLVDACKGIYKDRKSTRLNSSHKVQSRMPSSA